MRRRRKTPNDQERLDDIREWLGDIGAGRTPPVVDGQTADLTPEERADALRCRAKNAKLRRLRRQA